MWMRFVDLLRCPYCHMPLVAEPFEQDEVTLEREQRIAARERGIVDRRLAQHVQSGVLLCAGCRSLYPIADGVPVLLCYLTAVHDDFRGRHGERLRTRYAGYAFPDDEPPSGERAVLRSFSTEWRDYDYDGVIWELDYEDYERRLVNEMGPALERSPQRVFLEVGCGLGITTALAQKHTGGDAVGLDLSLAVWKASRHYGANPFLHFVEASVFALPFAPGSFDLVYSRGVLHHTVSTQRAFESMARVCRGGGTVYLWVYGKGSIRETLFRRAAYAVERVTRPALSLAPNSMPAKAFLAAMGTGYVLFNGVRRIGNPSIQPLTLARGVHAARDRFTPRYAHRHELEEVTGWFRRAGFDAVEVVDWRAMPPAERDDFRRNLGVRATLGPPEIGEGAR